jgi:hypothetical protein
MKSVLAGAVVVAAIFAMCVRVWAIPGATIGSTVSGIAAPADRPEGMAPPPRSHRASWPSEAERERVRVRIGLTKAQGRRIEQIHEDTERQKQVIVSRMREVYRQLRSLYDEYSYDRRKAEVLRKEILALHARRLELFGQNEEQLRRIMSRDQFAKMRAMMQEEWQKREHRSDRRPPSNRDEMPPPGRPR